MSRTVIAVVVAAVIAALTLIAFFVTSASFDTRLKKDSDAQLKRAYEVVQKLTQLEGIDVGNKAERLAALPQFVRAIKAGDSTNERQSQSRLGFSKFTSDEKQGEIKPDLIALVNIQGEILAMNDVPSVFGAQWKNEKPDPDNEVSGPTIIPALNVILSNKRVIISDIWIDHDRMMKIGVAPVIDPEAYNPRDPDGVVILGAIVVAYAQTAREAQNDRRLLGTEIAYYDSKRVYASSFTRGSEEDTARSKQLTELLGSDTVKEGMNEPAKVNIDGADYLAAAVPLQRTNTKALPQKYPKITAGAMVLAPISDPTTAGMAWTIKLLIAFLGAAALTIALVGLYLAHRRIIAQVDHIELGVNDIINGNLDRTFRPVGAELDGHANGLNVMLARLLGRPEPGEEEFDDEGNPIVPGRVEFEEGDETGAKPAPDPDLAALAQESEPDYYKRVFTEYQTARRAAGSPDDGSFENFIAKLKFNEGKLKAQYQCRAVRFRVVTKDGKVSLKPVPIYA
jgi:hypothetical protein